MTVLRHLFVSSVLLILFVSAPPPASSTEAFSGAADLKGWCENMDHDDVHWGLCVGSITAAHDMVMTYQNFEDMADLVCIRPTDTRGDVVTAVMEYMDEHPEELDYSLGDLVLAALIDKFPCHGAPHY